MRKVRLAMRLYFMRHAQAVDPEDWTGEEVARPLTDKGRKRAEDAAAGLARLRPGIGVVISSPLVRAYETAAIVGRVIGLPAETSDLLRPGFDLMRLDQALGMRPDADGPLFVGHEPDLGQLVSALTRHGRDQAVVMKKASCALVVTPGDAEGGVSVVELVGKCELAWLRDWRELSGMSEAPSEGD